jgi:hypothetical protein
MFRRPLSLVALSALLSPAALAQTATFVETFDGSSNTGSWSWGVPGPTIPAAGGNPGAFLREDFLDSCCPLLSTGAASSVFTGNYRAMGVTSVGVDLNVLDVDFSSAGRPLTIELFNDNGTPANTFDDFGAWFVGPDDVPTAGTGWFSYDFAFDSQSSSLPPGWVLFRVDGGTPTHTFDDVITSVDRLGYFYGDPEFFFIFQGWEMGLDNARIELADCDGNGVGDVLDIGNGTWLDLDGDLRPDVCQELSANVGAISLASGGAQDISLHAGAANAFELYWILGSVSGTSPGIPLSGGGELPLVIDDYFLFTLLNPNTLPSGSLAFLDANGAASAQWAIPGGLSPSLVGTVFFHAYLTLDPVTLESGIASNWIRLRLIP